MAWQYRRRKKVAPGVYLNIGKHGYSTTIKGMKGLSVTMGDRGTYLNTSIPGTGFYKRQRLDSTKPAAKNKKTSGDKSSFVDQLGCIVPVVVLWTMIAFLSFHMDGWLAILLSVVCSIASFICWDYFSSRHEKKSTEFSYKSEIKSVEAILAQEKSAVKASILCSYLSCLRLSCQIDEEDELIEALKQKGNSKFKKLIDEHQQKINKLIEERDSARFDAMNGVSEWKMKRYRMLAESVVDIAPKQWYKDIEHEISIGYGVFDYIKCKDGVPVIDIPSEDIKIFLYPAFWIVSKSNTDFQLIPHEDVSVTFAKAKLDWIEAQKIPNELNWTYLTYLHTTKDGKKDHRYSNNPLMAKAEVGLLNIDFLESPILLSYSDNPLFVSCYDIYVREGESVSYNTDNELNKGQIDNGSNDDYLIDLEKATDEIFRIYTDCLKNNAFNDVLSQSPRIRILGSDGKSKNRKETIQALFLTDLIKCFVDLGNSINVRKKEALGITYFYAKIYGYNIDIRNMITVSHNISDSFEDVIRQLSVIKYNGFIIADMLGECDKEKRLSYLVGLYRFSSITAKADDVIDEKEQSLLAKILSMKESVEGDSGLKKSDNAEQPIVANTKTSQSQLDDMVGLTFVKQEVHKLANFIKIQNQRKQQGLQVPSISYHCVFTGNPGTGKTTVARILATIYKELGVCKKGHLVETDRAGLVAEYVGQTAVKTNKIIDSALDGVLFIDEAYSLVSGGQQDYGKEAIDTLLKRMEDDRDRLVVIIAGYKDEMKNLIDSNPGLQSRFNRYIEFADYNEEELLMIFEKLAIKYDYNLTPAARQKLKDVFGKATLNKDKRFGNGRFVRNVFEKTLENQANRLSAQQNITADMLKVIDAMDISD